MSIITMTYLHVSCIRVSLQLSVLEYQTAVMRSDFDTADRILPTVPSHYRTRVAHFLEKQVHIIFYFPTQHPYPFAYGPE